ncbi:MAG: hypothetical protein AABZ53_13625 [Planctomycetota bacterium]
MISVESITRRCWSQTLAGAILAGGAWYLALHSSASDLGTARAELAAQRLLLKDAGTGETPTTKDSTEAAMHAQEARFKSLALEGPEPEKLYDAIVAAASECAVRIDRLNPSRNTTRGREIETKTGIAVGTIDFSMEFRGEFAGAVKFLNQVETGLGIVRVNTLRMVPERSPDGVLIVVANIETSHFKPQTPLPVRTQEKPRS